MLKKSKIGKRLLGYHYIILTSFQQKRPRLKDRIFLGGCGGPARGGVARGGRVRRRCRGGVLRERGDRGSRAGDGADRPGEAARPGILC